jgi:hypothetical protein
MGVGTCIGILPPVQQTAPRALVRPWMRPVYFALGTLFLVVGVVGIALPLVPTTGPVILAAFFFARSSDRFHTWLVEHPRLGPVIADFRSGRGIPRGTKIWALTAMSLAFGAAALLVTGHWVARTAVLTAAVLSIGYVARIPAVRRLPRR